VVLTAVQQALQGLADSLATEGEASAWDTLVEEVRALSFFLDDVSPGQGQLVALFSAAVRRLNRSSQRPTEAQIRALQSVAQRLAQADLTDEDLRASFETLEAVGLRTFLDLGEGADFFSDLADDWPFAGKDDESHFPGHLDPDPSVPA